YSPGRHASFSQFRPVATDRPTATTAQTRLSLFFGRLLSELLVGARLTRPERLSRLSARRTLVELSRPRSGSLESRPVQQLLNTVSDAFRRLARRHFVHAQRAPLGSQSPPSWEAPIAWSNSLLLDESTSTGSRSRAASAHGVDEGTVRRAGARSAKSARST